MRSPLVVFMILVVAAAGCAPKARWERVSLPTDAYFDGIAFTDSLEGWLAGGGPAVESGIVGHTRDGGRTWAFTSGVLPEPGTHLGIGRIQFLDARHGWAASGRGVLATSDGGASWQLSYDGAGADFNDVQFLDERRGFAIGAARLVATVDGGATWNVLLRNTSENGYPTGNGLCFFDERRGWVTGHNGRLLHTEDGGAGWTDVRMPLEPGEHPIFRGVTFHGEQDGWVYGDAGVLFHTRDGGASWTRQTRGVPIVRVIPKGETRVHEVVPELETPPDRLAIADVAFLDTSRGWAVGSYADVAESVVLRTDDGGDTWRTEAVAKDVRLRSLCALDPRHAWAVGDRPRRTPQVLLRFVAAGGR